MKYLKTNYFSKDNFIVGYEILNGNIYVNYASLKESEAIPYNAQEEIRIIKQMKEQVIAIKKELTNLQEKVKQKVTKTSLLIIPIVTLLTIQLMKMGLNKQFLETFYNITLVIFLYYLVVSSVYIKKYQEIKNDLKKHLYFLENEDIIQKNLNNNFNLVQTLSIKTEEIIISRGTTSAFYNQLLLNLSDVSEIPLEDLEKIVDYQNQKLLLK